MAAQDITGSNKIETEINRLKYPSFRRTEVYLKNDNTPREQNIAQQQGWRRVQSVTYRKKEQRRSEHTATTVHITQHIKTDLNDHKIKAAHINTTNE